MMHSPLKPHSPVRNPAKINVHSLIGWGLSPDPAPSPAPSPAPPDLLPLPFIPPLLPPPPPEAAVTIDLVEASVMQFPSSKADLRPRDNGLCMAVTPVSALPCCLPEGVQLCHADAAARIMIDQRNSAAAIDYADYVDRFIHVVSPTQMHGSAMSRL